MVNFEYIIPAGHCLCNIVGMCMLHSAQSTSVCFKLQSGSHGCKLQGDPFTLTLRVLTVSWWHVFFSAPFDLCAFSFECVFVYKFDLTLSPKKGLN